MHWRASLNLYLREERPRETDSQSEPMRDKALMFVLSMKFNHMSQQITVTLTAPNTACHHMESSAPSLLLGILLCVHAAASFLSR